MTGPSPRSCSTSSAGPRTARAEDLAGRVVATFEGAAYPVALPGGELEMTSLESITSGAIPRFLGHRHRVTAVVWFRALAGSWE